MKNLFYALVLLFTVASCSTEQIETTESQLEKLETTQKVKPYYMLKGFKIITDSKTIKLVSITAKSSAKSGGFVSLELACNVEAENGDSIDVYQGSDGATYVVPTNGDEIAVFDNTNALQACFDGLPSFPVFLA